ncbi:MAG: hypothetical protein VX258_13595 [Pseudomonadota bacterium]|nr:hypothetical protein [Pseudomonadota bacterium]
MKHLFGAALLIAVVILIIIGLTSDEQAMEIPVNQSAAPEQPAPAGQPDHET